MIDKYASRRGPRRAPWKAHARTISHMTNTLFDLMNHRRITQKAVAAAMGKHPVTLSYWRNGVHDMSTFDLEQMAAALGYRWQLVKNGARIDEEDAK